MIGVWVGRAVFETAGEDLGDGVGVAGRGAGLLEVLTPTTGELVGVATGADADSKLIDPAFHICVRFEALISTSIGTRLGFAGC